MIASDPKRWWPAPAKLNLCLHVTARRADGYHELQTIFQLISLADQLSFDLRDDHESFGSTTRAPRRMH